VVAGPLGLVDGLLKAWNEASRPPVNRHSPIATVTHAGSRSAVELSRGTRGTPSGTILPAVTRTANSRGRSTAASDGSTSTSSGLIASMTAGEAIAPHFARAGQRPSARPGYSSRADGTIRVSIASTDR
jgi:hypothetical protein